jgi:PAS domain S-box-containing protein
MVKKGASRRDPAGLRRRAEELLRGKPVDLGAIPAEEAGRLLHELRVYQVELEMQNDELRRAQQELEASRVKYFDLYEMAPVGYFNLSEKGLIVEANLRAAQLLGVGRTRLVKQLLTRYIVPEDQDIHYLHRKRLLETGVRQECELRMSRQDGSPFWARMETIATRDGEDGPSVYRTTVSDITESKRTAELLTANRLMKKMIDEGKRAAERIATSRERLRNLSRRLQSVVEEERMRISREIHDELGQVLTGVKLDLLLVRRMLASKGLTELSAKVLENEQAISSIVLTVRKIATELRPGILDELGVPAAIEWMAKDFQKRTGVGCNVRIKGVGKISDIALTTAIFRIVQESLTNIMRHAGASQANVNLEKKDGALILEVTDNGSGIEEGRIMDFKSLGLIGIRERVLLLGGEVVISGKPGEGTRVRVTLPVEGGASSDA